MNLQQQLAAAYTPKSEFPNPPIVIDFTEVARLTDAPDVGEVMEMAMGQPVDIRYERKIYIPAAGDILMFFTVNDTLCTFNQDQVIVMAQAAVSLGSMELNHALLWDLKATEILGEGTLPLGITPQRLPRQSV